MIARHRPRLPRDSLLHPLLSCHDARLGAAFQVCSFLSPSSGHVFMFYFETMSSVQKSAKNSTKCTDTLCPDIPKTVPQTAFQPGDVSPGPFHPRLLGPPHFCNLDPKDHCQLLCKPPLSLGLSGVPSWLDRGLSLLSRNITQEEACPSLPPGAWHTTPTYSTVGGVGVGRPRQVASILSFP